MPRIFTASYFDHDCWHGTPIAISRGVPADLLSKVDMNFPIRWELAPPEKLLNWWEEEVPHHSPTTEHIDKYTIAYRAHIQKGLSRIKQYLAALELGEDQTWLCYEPSGKFCHRNLAIRLVQQLRPDLYGGTDVSMSQQQALFLTEPVEEAPAFITEKRSDSPPTRHPKIFDVGDQVSNSKGWTGTIKKIDVSNPADPRKQFATPDGRYYWVYWKERAEHVEPTVSRHPICGTVSTNLILIKKREEANDAENSEA
jgi:hypothetical protein